MTRARPLAVLLMVTDDALARNPLVAYTGNVALTDTAPVAIIHAADAEEAWVTAQHGADDALARWTDDRRVHHCRPGGLRSASVGDVVLHGGTYHQCAPRGWTTVMTDVGDLQAAHTAAVIRAANGEGTLDSGALTALAAALDHAAPDARRHATGTWLQRTLSTRSAVPLLDPRAYPLLGPLLYGAVASTLLERR